ncbi:MAG: U32 family peptidase [Atopobiaceae bacterium]|nr:U32 family peptidase [Atopobiaceae bacterium]
MGQTAVGIGLCVPFVNDATYVESLSALAKQAPNSRCIFEVYGSLPQDPVGNLRPAESIRPTSLDELKRHIARLHEANIRFNYVMNSELLPIPLTPSYRQEVLSFVDNLVACGVDEITVTIPYLMSLFKKHVPSLRVNASICNEIASVREAVEFEQLGAGVLVLDRDANRDFELIRQIRQQVKAEIKVLCNSACVYHCINVHYHGTYSSALSSSAMPLRTADATAPLTPYCSYYCRLRFFSDPAELIRMHWIRPEDLDLYAQEGVALFKIDGRDKDPAYLLEVTRAYLTGSYGGNLFHLLQPEFVRDMDEISLGDGEQRPELDTARLRALTEDYLAERSAWPLGIDNRDLDGFAHAFVTGKVACQGNCVDCGYCDAFAHRIRYDASWRDEMTQVMRYNYEQY